MAQELLQGLAAQVGDDLAKGILEAKQTDEAGIKAQRDRVAALKQKLAGINTPEAKSLADAGRHAGEAQHLDHRW